MRVQIEVAGGADDERGQPEQPLHRDRSLDLFAVTRGQSVIAPGWLNAVKVRSFVTTDGLSPMAVEGPSGH